MASDSLSQIIQSADPGGLHRIVIENDAVRLAVFPEAGGKIHELVDRRSGFNWLWHHPRLKPVSQPGNAPYVEEQDCGGWDEILLSVAPGELTADDGETWDIPDHGSVVGVPWTVQYAGLREDGSAELHLQITGSNPEFRFSRRLLLAPDSTSVQLEYELENLSASRLPAYWCAHPLLSVDESTRIQIDGEPPIAVYYSSENAGRPGNEQQWPMFHFQDQPDIDLARCLGDGADRNFSAKLFVQSPADGTVSISRSGGSERLAMKFDAELMPWTGLWINRRDWSGSGDAPYFNLGVEPSTSGTDCVRQAIRDNDVSWLEPGSGLQWSLTLDLGA